VQRSVHVARIERKESNTFLGELLIPNSGQVVESGFAGSVGSPAGIWIQCSVALDIQNYGAPSLARGSGQGAQQGFRQSERTEEIGGQRVFEVLAIGIAQ
jgi:hypothetical protein